MTDIQQRIAQIVLEQCGPEIDYSDYYEVAGVVVSELGLACEDQWVPITESGARWTPRREHEAESARAAYPVGGSFFDGAKWDGITRVDHERRYVTEWVPDE